MTEDEGRAQIVAAAQEMERLGLNHGSAGNLSLRVGEAALVTPSGVASRDLSRRHDRAHAACGARRRL